MEVFEGDHEIFCVAFFTGYLGKCVQFNLVEK